MAAQFEAKSATQNFNGVTSVTQPHTVGATATALFVVVPYWSTSSSSGQLTGITWNGVTMVKVGDSGRSAGQDIVEIYALPAPATGAHNIVASFQSANNDGSVYGVSVTGSPTSGGLGTLWADLTLVVGTSNASTVTVPNNTANDMIIDGCVCAGGTGIPTMTAQTNRTLGASGNANGNGEAWSYLNPAPSGNQVMDYTINLSVTHAQLAIRVLGTSASLPPGLGPSLSMQPTMTAPPNW